MSDPPYPRADMSDVDDAIRAAESRQQLWLERRDVFTDCISDYERLRGYLSCRYGDKLTQAEVNAWMADNGHGLFVEGVPEANVWRDRFWPDPRYPEGSHGPTE